MQNTILFDHGGDRPGDFFLGEERFQIEVLALSDTRGPAAVAQALYRETDASQLARAQAREMRAAARNGFRPPETKPDKRARRLIRALGDIDAL